MVIGNAIDFQAYTFHCQISPKTAWNRKNLGTNSRGLNSGGTRWSEFVKIEQTPALKPVRNVHCSYPQCVHGFQKNSNDFIVNICLFTVLNLLLFQPTVHNWVSRHSKFDRNPPHSLSGATSTGNLNHTGAICPCLRGSVGVSTRNSFRGGAGNDSDWLFVGDYTTDSIHVFSVSDGQYMRCLTRMSDQGYGGVWKLQWCDSLSSLVVGLINDGRLFISDMQ